MMDSRWSTANELLTLTSDANFLEYIDGLRSWQSKFEWENVEPTKAIFPFVAVLIVLAGLIATVLLLIFGEY